MGEVFTSIPLCLKILENLPPKVWSNPNLKWCEPTAGKGNFMLVVYVKLMVGLRTWEPNEEKGESM